MKIGQVADTLGDGLELVVVERPVEVVRERNKNALRPCHSYTGKSCETSSKKIIESEEMYNLYQFLKEESKKRKKLTPLPEDVFKAFQIDLNKMEVVVMGMD